MQPTTVLLVLLTSTVQVFAGAVFTELSNTPPGNAPFHDALAISADGAVVVGTTGIATEFAGNGAAMWTSSTGSIDLGNLTSSALGVSSDGLVVVGDSSALLGSMAYRWTAQSGVVGLGYLPDLYDSIANATSSDGSVVVGASSKIGGGVTQAFRWTFATGMVGIGPGDDLAVSDDGSVIVGHNADGGFRWTAATGQIILGPQSATAVSSDGSIVVGYGHFESLGQRAYRWTEATGIQPILTDLAGNPFRSEAHAVSADGSIIVGSGYRIGDGTEEAIIWDEVNGIRTMKTWLQDDYGLDLSGIILERAYGISDDGSVIVGSGNGGAWMVTIPEPSTMALAALAVVAFLHRRAH